MKKFITTIWLIFLLSCLCFAQENSKTKRTVRVFTYNILHGATLNNNFDLEKIANVINSVSPDLVALQEVDFKTNRAKKKDLVTELGKLTDMGPLFGKAMKYDDGEYGEGILSKFSFNETKTHPLPHFPDHEPRAALAVNVTLPFGEDILFVGTHLDHMRDQADRIAQAKKINEIFKSTKLPTILAGDLNATPNSEPIKILTRFWTDATASNPEPTMPSSEPQRKIDYIMFCPKERWRVIETKVICDKVASDHCGLLVVLELLEQ